MGVEIRMVMASGRPFGATLALGTLLFVGLTAMSSAGQPPRLRDPIALGQLEKGMWELRVHGDRSKNNAPVKSLCLGDPAQLLRVRHGGDRCRHFIVSDADRRAAITYQCEGSGGGRTDLRVETPRLVQIETQGIEDGAPFALSLEGRRIGDCR